MESSATPLVEPHLHTDTGHSAQSLHKIGNQFNIAPFAGKSLEEVARMVDVPVPDNALSAKSRWDAWYEYLKIKRQAYISPKVIGRLIEDVILEAAADGVNILELRISLLSTVDTLLQNLKIEANTVLRWRYAEKIFNEVVKAIERTSAKITTDLLVSVSCQKKYASLVPDLMKFCLDHKNRIAAIDLTNEGDIDPEALVPQIEGIRGDIRGLTVHCMEVNGPDIGWKVLEYLRPDRIGHGVRMVEDPRLLAKFAELGIPCEICFISNHVTGTVMDMAAHPARKMFEAGIPLMVGSDIRDGGSTLSRNFSVMERAMHFTPEEMDGFRANNFRYAFRNMGSVRPA